MLFRKRKIADSLWLEVLRCVKVWVRSFPVSFLVLLTLYMLFSMYVAYIYMFYIPNYSLFNALSDTSKKILYIYMMLN